MQREPSPIQLRTRNAWTKADSAALLGFAAMLGAWVLMLIILFAHW